MPITPSPLRRLLGIAWLAFAVLVIATAVIIGLARLLLPLADGYRQEIEQLASQQLGHPVEIGALSAGWYGLHPDLRVQDVRVLTARGGRPWLAFDQIRASIDVIPSLLQGRLRTGAIHVLGAEIDIVHRDDGSWGILGLEPARRPQGEGLRRLLEFLAAHDRLRVIESTLRLHDRRISRAPLEFAELGLKVDAAAQRWRVSGTSALAGQQGRHLAFVLEAEGNPLAPEARQVRLYLDGQLRLGQWLDGTAVGPLGASEGDIGLRLWVEGGVALESVVGELDARELHWRPGAQARLQALGARVFWLRRDDGWRLLVEGLQVARDGRAWPESSAQVRWRELEGGGFGIDAAVGYLRLEDLRGFLPALAEHAPRAVNRLQELAPAGALIDAEGRYRQVPGRAPSYFLRTGFEDLALAPVGPRPGVRGADGRLVLDEGHGHLLLDSRDLQLPDPARFRRPLAAAQASAQAYWRARERGWEVQVPQFAVHDPALDLHGSLRLTLAPETSPHLELHASLDQARLGAVGAFLPARTMPPRLVAWLDRALVAGRAHDGRVIFSGPLAAFPFEDGGGRFEVDFAVEDAILDYGHDWPRLEEAIAGVRFSNRSMEATVHAGRILDLEVERATVSIPRLGAEAALGIEAQARGPAGDVLGYLAKGPLRADPPPILDELRADGPVGMALHLTLPLHALRDARLEGRLALQGVDVRWPAREQHFEGLEGEVQVGYRDGQPAFEAEAIALRWRDEPGRLDVRTEGVGQDRHWRLSLTTVRALHDLIRRELGQTPPAFVEGTSPWTVALDVAAPRDGRMAVALLAESTLRGVAVTLPPPLGKASAESRTLRLRAELGVPGALPLRAQYGQAHAALQLEAGRVARGEVRWGAPARLPQEAGLVLAGRLERLDIGVWRAWLSGGTAAAGAGSGGWTQDLQRIDLAVQSLELFGRTLHDVTIDGRRDGRYWRGAVHGREAGGAVALPVDLAAGDPLRLELAYLHLARGPGDGADRGDTTAAPAAIPPLEVTSDLFTYNGIAFGRLALSTRPLEDGLAVRRLELSSPYLEIAMQGQWREGPRGQTSRFTVDAHSNDLGDALRRSGFAGTIEGGDAQVHLEASWPGPPTGLALATLDGHLELDIRRGQFLELDPGGGRILGLLSLHALPRRLALDFSDLFRRGFAFDRIAGTFAIADGDAYTNDLYLEGPAARIEVSGRTGLDSRDYDQLAVVTPRMSSSIPVVGGLAGGPAVALGLWMAERVFGKRIDELSRVRYAITGSWEDPVVRRLEAGDGATD